MTVSQLLVWTALPTGVSGRTVRLSVFLTPQLSATTPPGHSFAPLSLFPDFVDWPATIAAAPHGPVSFKVTFKGFPAVPATIVTPAPPAGVNAASAWKAIFAPANTKVDPWQFTDYSTYGRVSFPAATIASFVSSLYGEFGTVAPTSPLTLTTVRGQFSAATKQGDTLYSTLLGLFPPGNDFNAVPDIPEVPDVTTAEAFAELRAFHAPPAGTNPAFVPTRPTLDFHQAVTGFGNYPVVLRLFHLAFDLTAPLPAGLTTGAVELLVEPTWTSALGSENTDLTPWTAATLTTTTFRPTPLGPDYANGMLGLNDTTRFSVTALDVDLAGDRLDNLSTALQTQATGQESLGHASNYGANFFGPPDGSTTAVTVPALRSVGPQVIWTGYADSTTPSGFAGLLDGQASLQSALEAWQSAPSTSTLPVVYAEQLIRGHRFDVWTGSETHPAWRSLCGRWGTYVFGPHGSSPIKFKEADEGIITPGATQPAGTTSPPPPELYVHEAIVRWHGWGLSAQRPGGQISNSSSTVESNPGNMPPAPSSTGASAPQLSAFFAPPSPTVAPTLLFPKLRFGNEYRFRARAVDLAGNSLPVSSTDASTATALFKHYRYEPVRPPVVAGTAPFGPGESTLYLVLLDDQVNAPGTNGRWLFAPKVSQVMAEEHGMFDGFSPGSPHNPADKPNGNLTTYDTIKEYDAKNLGDVTTDRNNPSAPLIGTYDAANHGTPYFTGSPMPYTPWLPDPLSRGPALAGLPGAAAGSVLTEPWRGVWPVSDPVLVQLGAGTTRSNHYVPATASTPATVEVTLPKAEVALVKLSSALTANAHGALGVAQWLPSTVISQDAAGGQVWLLTPYQILRMVHAVRLPLIAPALGSPATSREPGATSVDVSDPEFAVDTKSTSHVDVFAKWTDPYDNPSDPSSDPAAPAIKAAITGPPPTPRSTITSEGPAFRLSIPDPTPTGPDAQPLTVSSPKETFAFGPSFEDYAQSATHHIGDTQHHLVYYTSTGSSRFADLFEETVDADLTVGTPFTIGTAALGINPDAVEVTITYEEEVALLHGGTRIELVTAQLEPVVDFSVDATARTVTVLHTFGNVIGDNRYPATITFQPKVTVTGAAKPVEVLSSARPKAPVISQIVPAWQLAGPSGTLGAHGISVERTGGFLRVYLERPWYSSGAGELLGVVTTVPNPDDLTGSVMPSTAQQAFVTMMGLDPINFVQSSNSPWPVVPTSFANLAPMPAVPYRGPYSSPPQVYLVEDDTQLYQVWPYEVAYDSVSGRWYADIAPRPGITSDEGTYPPPPGYFIRLALCRFQPFSESYTQGNTVEVSPVVTATIAQPVPNRTVVVVADSADTSGRTLLVSVSGPAYQGWRPPNDATDDVDFQYDLNNPFAPPNPSIYGSEVANGIGTMHTSTMVVEVQIQSEALIKEGLGGDFVWVASDIAPVRLNPEFTGEVFVDWGGTGPVGTPQGVVKLPDSHTSSTKMRLRISELDYYQEDTAPAAVNTSFRRPFVTLIPVN